MRQNEVSKFMRFYCFSHVFTAFISPLNPNLIASVRFGAFPVVFCCHEFFRVLTVRVCASSSDTMRKRASIHGVFLTLATKSEIEEMHSAIAVALTRRVLKMHVGHVFPLEKVAEAHRLIISPQDGANGKIILHPW